MGKGTSETVQTADQLYADLQASAIEVLYDDRDESPGVKFNDADLIGLPLRLTVSDRALKQGGVEMKRRDRTEKTMILLSEVVSSVIDEIARMQAEIDARVIETAYDG